MFEVKMPQWGMNMTEGTVVKWFKQVGDRVEKGEPLAEIEIAKAVNDLQSPVAGVIAKLVVGEGETVHVQHVLALVSE